VMDLVFRFVFGDVCHTLLSAPQLEPMREGIGFRLRRQLLVTVQVLLCACVGN